jgi:uncharacterized membrane protein (Fun14 family)
MELPHLTPYLGQVTFGGLAGYAVGYALKKVGRALAIVLGLLFIALQLLAQAGYVQVDWTRIQRDVEPLLQQPGLKSPLGAPPLHPHLQPPLRGQLRGGASSGPQGRMSLWGVAIRSTRRSGGTGSLG